MSCHRGREAQRKYWSQSGAEGKDETVARVFIVVSERKIRKGRAGR